MTIQRKTNNTSFKGIYHQSTYPPTPGRITSWEADNLRIAKLVREIQSKPTKLSNGGILTIGDKSGDILEVSFLDRLDIVNPKTGDKWLIKLPDIAPELKKQFEEAVHKACGYEFHKKSLIGFCIDAVNIIGTHLAMPSKRFKINQLDVPVNNLPKELEGLKIAHISDIHAGDIVKPKYVQALVDKVNSLKPDIVFITGDFVDKDTKHLDETAKILAQLNSKPAIFGVMGNHDIVFADENKVYSALKENGLQILRNTNQGLFIDKTDPQNQKFEAILPQDLYGKKRPNLYIAGIDDYYSGCVDINNAMRGIPKGANVILLSHHPDVVESINSERFNLILSGHLHGGQVKIPLYGAVEKFIPSKYGKHFIEGLKKLSENCFINNSTGIGPSGIPFRVNCPPEISILTLKKNE